MACRLLTKQTGRPDPWILNFFGEIFWLNLHHVAHHLHGFQGWGGLSAAGFDGHGKSRRPGGDVFHFEEPGHVAVEHPGVYRFAVDYCPQLIMIFFRKIFKALDSLDNCSRLWMLR